MKVAQTEIAVIGAGVVGIACALRLAQAGREVTLIDPAAPGSGASYGNAGTIADYAVQPVGTPGVLRDLPSLLFDRNSPLAIRRAAIFSLAPWLTRFAVQSLPKAAERNARAIAALLEGAAPRWRELAAEAGAGGYLREKGCLYAYQSAKARAGAEGDIAFRKVLGIEAELISPQELAVLEPNLPEMPGGGCFFPQAVFLTDPQAVVTALFAQALAHGATLRSAQVTRLERQVDGPLLDLATPDGPARLRARHVVIAAGAQSRALALMAGDKVPLDTERGYHLEFDMAEPLLTRPTCPTSRGFYLCPMQGRLRVAGTVELGGLTAPPSPHRLARLLEGARAIFPQLPEPSREWMGFRPSLPDSLPVIGPSRMGADVIHAYGHGHIGLTLAPVTAEAVAAIIGGERVPIDLASTSVARF